MQVKKPDIKTLNDLIGYETYYDVRKYLKPESIEGINFYNTTLFDIYLGMIKPYIERVATLPEHKKYNHKPRNLSRDLYGTPDLDWVLLKINGASPSRFVIGEKINYIHPDDLDFIFDLLSSKLST